VNPPLVTSVGGESTVCIGSSGVVSPIETGLFSYFLRQVAGNT